MATNPIPSPLPADLPTNWVRGQTIAPAGSDVGLAQQYGYNYLMAAVNAAQSGVNTIGNAFSGLATTTQIQNINNKINNLQDAVDGCAQIEFGTYVGTGTNGSKNKNSLTFGFLPKIIFIFRTSGGTGTPLSLATFLIMPYASAYAPSIGTSSGAYVSISTTTSQKKISWYSSNDAISQMNEQNWTYTYVAVG